MAASRSSVDRVAPPPAVASQDLPQIFRPVSARVTPRHARISREPEVLVSAAEAAALRNLIRGVRDGRIDIPPFLDASAPTVMELAPLTDIAIPPIVIEPLASNDGAEGVRQ